MATKTATARRAPDIARAAADPQYYADEREHLDADAQEQFDTATAAHYAQACALTDTDRRVLDFAGKTFRHPGQREAAIRAEFGVSAVCYHQILNSLIDRPEAQLHAPVLVKRLRERRDAARRSRRARDLGRLVDPRIETTRTAPDGSAER
jgi:hypothetical protein